MKKNVMDQPAPRRPNEIFKLPQDTNSETDLEASTSNHFVRLMTGAELASLKKYIVRHAVNKCKNNLLDPQKTGFKGPIVGLS